MLSNSINALLIAEIAGVPFEIAASSNGNNSGISYAIHIPDLTAMEATLKEKGLPLTMHTRLDAAGKTLAGEPEEVSIFDGMRRAVFAEAAENWEFIAAQTKEALDLLGKHSNLEKALKLTQKLIEDQYASSDAMISQLSAQSKFVEETIRTFICSRELVENEIREILETAVPPAIFKRLYSGATTLSQVHTFVRVKLDELSEMKSKPENRHASDILHIMRAVGHQERYTASGALRFLEGRDDFADKSINPLIYYKAIAEILRSELRQQAPKGESLIQMRVEHLEHRMAPKNRMVGYKVGGYYALTLRTGKVDGRNVNHIDVEVARRVLEAYGKSKFGLGIAASYQPVRTAEAVAGTGHDSFSIENPAPCETEVLERLEKMLAEKEFEREVMLDWEIDRRI